ncbi:response regulator, partial [Bradyrhizobium sp. Ai1a-2]|uniref:response regulator transcription factor n=1 Tax=Bradyrhizobium sp. Ai1a-2 TaxID=196490 RepID=UPI00040ABDE3
MKVLVVEDQPALRILIGGHLSEHGFAVDEVSRAADAMAATAVSSYDAIILDLGLLDGDGLELLARLSRKAPIKTPVLVVGAPDDMENRGRAFDVGADDYIVKPIDPIELETRLRVLLHKPRH